jgi:hypothetical protein
MEIAMRRGDMLQEIATNNWAEYFIGIGKDQHEVLKAKSKFAELDPPNASAFWGDTHKLLPSILNKSIDNFLITLPQIAINHATKLDDGSSLRSILTILPQKLSVGGTLQILTDLEINSITFNELIAMVLDTGFQINPRKDKKIYFPKDWKDSDFIQGRTPQVLLFMFKGV